LGAVEIMPLLDLYRVTEVLRKLLKTRIQASPAWPTKPSKGDLEIVPSGGIPANLEVSPERRDKVREMGGPILGLYLCHVSADPHQKNSALAEGGRRPIQHPTIALKLYYQLAPYCEMLGDSEVGSLYEQLLLGLALKVLHDHPIIDDSTMLVDRHGNAERLLALVGLNGDSNRFSLSVQPIPLEQAISCCMFGSSLMHLSTYCVVSGVLLGS